LPFWKAIVVFELKNRYFTLNLNLRHLQQWK